MYGLRQWLPDPARAPVRFALFLATLLVGFAPAAAMAAVTVSTVAGTSNSGDVDGAGASALFDNPSDVGVDSLGNLYVADMNNDKIRKITPGGIVSTFAPLYTAEHIAIDGSNTLYVVPNFDNAVHKITPGAVVSLLAGASSAGYIDATGSAARFHYPEELATDSAGNVYVGDTYNHVVRKITPNGVVTTFAGSGGVGSTDGAAASATFGYPTGIALDAAGNVYVADYYFNNIRKITISTTQVSTYAGIASQTPQFADGAPASARFAYPWSMVFDNMGYLYVADSGNNRIRRIAPNGWVSTLAGTGAPAFLDGPGLSAKFNHPSGIAWYAPDNALYVADSINQRIRKITIDTGRLKLCKVAGPGVAPGQSYVFQVTADYGQIGSLAVPAGPAPGGYCIVGPQYPADTVVTLAEQLGGGNSVTSIAVSPAGRLNGSANLSTGSVSVTIGTGITEVTYTDRRPTGFLEICKGYHDGPQPPDGSATFTVYPGAIGPITVPAGACSPAIEVAAGTVFIYEAAPSVMYGCSAIPANRQVGCTPAARKSTVTVVTGDISTQTIANITNLYPVIDPNGGGTDNTHGTH